MATIVRAKVMHTPRDPFVEDGALAWFEDGGLAFSGGQVVACGSFSSVFAEFPGADVMDARPGFLLPGFVDCHVHYPQLRVIGAMGLELMDWLRVRALPEEARLADIRYAREVAERFVQGLLSNGTTCALVFGSHFVPAQDELFSAAATLGLRVTSGLVLSDRNLLPELHVSPDEAVDRGRELIERWHERGRARYAVSPRFAVSCSDHMLEACGSLLAEADNLLFTTHLNETCEEVRQVRSLFPWARDYLETYERYGLVREGSVFAHDVHVTDHELGRLAAGRAAVAHCPSSNAFLGSGLFQLRRHLDSRVPVALGSDVGAGTGFSMLKEGLAAYEGQMLLEDGYQLTPVELLYLATSAGAQALGLGDVVGDFGAGKSADFVVVRPPDGSALQAVLDRAEGPEAALGALFTLAREDAITEVRVEGELVWGR